jgi:hypothetical protein
MQVLINDHTSCPSTFGVNANSQVDRAPRASSTEDRISDLWAVTVGKRDCSPV